MRKLSIMIAMLALVFAAACQSNQNADSASEPDEPEATASTEAEAEEPRFERRRPPREPSDNRPPPRMEGGLVDEGPGLTFIIDATDMDTLEQSLELIADETSQAQYQRLQGSIDMLRFYSLQPTDQFYSSLDGMTGEEIIERAQERRQRRR